MGSEGRQGQPSGLATAVRRALRRQGRRLRNRFDPPRATFVYDPLYEKTLFGLPHDPLRADRILAFLCNESLIRRSEISRPRPVALKNILLVHTPAYIEQLQQPQTLTSILGVPVGENDLNDTLDVQRVMVGGTIQATRVALATRQVAINLGGGFHHAGPAGGMGYCIFNDVAIAVRRLRDTGYRGRVLIVDLDLHDGNGTRDAFAEDDSVYTFSIHNQSWGNAGAVADTGIELGVSVTDEVYLGTLLKALPQVIDAFRPELVIYLAGVDVASDDRIGNWQISAEGVLARDRFVTAQVRACGAPLVIVLGGGYGELAWRYSARFLAWLVGDRVLEPPDNNELTLVRFRQIKSALDPIELTGGGVGGWQLTEEDLAGMLPGMPRQTRFLDYFSKVGVELLLERFGLLQQLRMRGFRTPELLLELDHPLGQTLKIYADAAHRHLLVELRVNRSRRLVPGCEVVVVEWLLLQNPTASFAKPDEALPGQSHPGLGLVGEFFGWLVVVCEALTLDGTYFRPSHYHVAALARRFARFLDPEHEGLFRALAALLGNQSLSAASRLVEVGGVRDLVSGETVRWEGFPMVVAASAALRQRLTAPDYERVATAAQARLQLVQSA